MEIKKLGNKIKDSWNKLDKEKLALDAVEFAGKAVIIGLAAIGAIGVLAVIESTIQEKNDPEGFRADWIAELVEQTKDNGILIVDLLAQKAE